MPQDLHGKPDIIWVGALTTDGVTRCTSQGPWSLIASCTVFAVSFIYKNTWQAMLKWLLTIPGLGTALRVDAMPALPMVASGMFSPHALALCQPYRAGCVAGSTGRPDPSSPVPAAELQLAPANRTYHQPAMIIQWFCCCEAAACLGPICIQHFIFRDQSALTWCAVY